MRKLFAVDTDCFADAGLARRAMEKLSPARRQRVGEFRYGADRRRSLGAGAALDCALRTAGLSEREADIRRDEFGKPYLANCTGLHFNLSHSGHFAVCALSDVPVGVDIQAPRGASERLIRRVCAPGEAAALLVLEGAERASRFARLWAAKESYMKWTGEGLRLSPRSLEIKEGPPPAMCRAGRPLDAVFWLGALEDHWLALCAGAYEEPEVRLVTPEEL